MTVMEWVAATNYPVDKLYLDKFWWSLQEGQLIYADDELIRWMGYDAAEVRDRKQKFVKLLATAGMKPGVDYFDFTNDEYATFLSDRAKNDKNLVRPIGRTKFYPPIDQSHGKNTTKHLLLTADCLKIVMMSLNTAKAGEIRLHYVTLEKLFRAYLIYQNNQRAEEQAAITEATSAQIVDLTRRLNNTKLVADELMQIKLFKEKSETVYIVTSKLYAGQGIFKVGRTKSMKARIGQLNTGHTVGDDLFVAGEFKTGCARQLEARVHHVLQHFRLTDNREFFRIQYRILHKVITSLEEHLNDEEDIANEVAIAMHEQQQSDPALIKWDEGMPLLIEAVPIIREDLDAPGAPGAPGVPINISAHSTLINIPAEPIVSAPTLSSDALDKLFTSARMTEANIMALLRAVMQENVKNGVIMQKDISSAVKNKLGARASDYRHGEWKIYITVAAGDMKYRVKRYNRK